MAKDDEWTTVSRTTKRKVAKRKQGSAQQRAIQLDVVDDDETNVDPAVVQAQLASCCEQIKTSQFYNAVTKAWEAFRMENDDDSLQIHEMVCYGIGNFARRKTSHYSAPLWQLALALQFRTILPKSNSTSMVYYDPLVTTIERQLLQDHYQIQVLSQNEKGMRNNNKNTTSGDDDNKKNATTVFFMPHCPKGLYENVLWANWTQLQQNARAICMIGNSLASYVERAAVVSTKDSDPSSCIELVQPFLREKLFKVSKKDVQNMPGHFEFAFDDTYLTWFEHRPVVAGDDDPVHSSSLWPARPDQPSPDGQLEVLWNTFLVISQAKKCPRQYWNELGCRQFRNQWESYLLHELKPPPNLTLIIFSSSPGCQPRKQKRIVVRISLCS